MLVPTEPKIYHIVHVDRLPSIISDGHLWSDAEARRRRVGGTTIGIDTIKQRRLTNHLQSHPEICVGECVPFYFCPRSVMLYVIHMANNPELAYRGGQDQIVHLEADFRGAIAWANNNRRRWAFTSSNAGANYFEDYADVGLLNKLDWQAIQAKDWRQCREAKQAEFLVQGWFPWTMVSRVGIRSQGVRAKVQRTVQDSAYRPRIEIKPGWYY